MGINSITGSALQGIHKGLQGMRRVASDIASANQVQQSNPKDLSRSMVEMQQQANLVKAQVKTLKAADETLGTLIDEKV
ncbi:MAG: hydrolase [Candidatus Thiodiazotropha lotti]|uniref:Hydrolase n=2 Tax=Candidatus Thiodiazotropha TaxID=1913444 RepID=A0A1E2V0R6_9GAMM|nr:hydrolase [Candidatus Thiodiazotropha endoloripes]MCG7898914.1 hydrolase [Candidatus Thiodiazotropha weberae]MCG7939294.1 hydrolase [Candidatus Thiodiazotropha lotti]MCG7902041.1 hydrolase [Candidatus Thiodiazotropha weberae]MCG7992003.1 hydrolase [Candidatus Thiodiazotropha lotti]MCG7998507.1 hydrolase [Candidatus Thiodiazotropha lotti]